MLFDNIINNTKQDKITVQVINDEIILEYGRRFLKNQDAQKQKHYISSKVRTLGDLVLTAKEKSNNVKVLKDILDPKMFDWLCDVVRQWSGYDEKTGICKRGSVPRRLTKCLKSCSSIIWSQAIKDETLSAAKLSLIQQQHDRFMSIMQSEWPVELSASGDRSVKINKVVKEDKMPMEDDLILFFCKVSEKIGGVASQKQD